MTNPYYNIPYEVREKFSIRYWVYEFKHSRQRMARGWSDRDTWGGGEHILRVTSGVLKKLGDEKSHIDWPEYFKTNYPHNQGYNDLNEVAKDIDDYLAFDEYAWGEALGFEIKHGHNELPNGYTEITSLNTPEEEKKIKAAILASRKEWEKRYKKAKKAMTFVAVNFYGLWD